MKRLKDEIKEKSDQIDLLEKQMSNYFIASEQTDQSGVSQVCSLDIIVALFHLIAVQLITGCFVLQAVAELMEQLNDKSFELEVTVIYHVLMFFKI